MSLDPRPQIPRSHPRSWMLDASIEARLSVSRLVTKLVCRSSKLDKRPRKKGSLCEEPLVKRRVTKQSPHSGNRFSSIMPPVAFTQRRVNIPLFFWIPAPASAATSFRGNDSGEKAEMTVGRKKAVGACAPTAFLIHMVSPDYLRKDIFLVSANLPLARR